MSCRLLTSQPRTFFHRELRYVHLPMSTRPIRVALVVPGLGSGGLERIVRDLSFELAARAYDPAIFCTTKPGLYADDLRRARIPVWDCGERTLRVLPTRLIRRLIRFAPDLVHAHGGAWQAAATARMLLRATPLMYTEHGRNLDSPKWRVAIERWSSRRTDRITAVSRAAAAELRCLLRLSVSPDVIANGVEAPASRARTRDELRREIGVASDDVLALTVGRLEEVKNHSLLLRAFASIADEVPNLHVAFVGGGRLQDRLREEAIRLGLKNRTWFAGHRTDVPDWLRAADFFVLSSAREGLPVSLLEAMAHGLATAATAVGGIPEVLQDSGGGVLVAPGDAAALGQAIAQLARDDSLRLEMGSHAQERVRSFSREKMIEGYCAAYRSVLEAKAASRQQSTR